MPRIAKSKPNKEKKTYSLDEIKPPFYPCPIYEQETVIQISRDSEEAHIYTNDLTMLTRLKRAAKYAGSQWRLTEIQYMGGRQCGWGFECPKRLVSFRTKSLAKSSEEDNPEAEPLAEEAEE